jgi:hypothetical protein
VDRDGERVVALDQGEAVADPEPGQRAGVGVGVGAGAVEQLQHPAAGRHQPRPVERHPPAQLVVGLAAGIGLDLAVADHQPVGEAGHPDLGGRPVEGVAGGVGEAARGRDLAPGAAQALLLGAERVQDAAEHPLEQAQLDPPGYQAGVEGRLGAVRADLGQRQGQGERRRGRGDRVAGGPVQRQERPGLGPAGEVERAQRGGGPFRVEDRPQPQPPALEVRGRGGQQQRLAAAPGDRGPAGRVDPDGLVAGAGRERDGQVGGHVAVRGCPRPVRVGRCDGVGLRHRWRS